MLEEAAGAVSVELSYCVVNTNGRDDLLACLDAIERTHPPELEHELLVLDNASDDGSADAVRERFPEAELIALERRARARPRTTRCCSSGRAGGSACC